MNEHAILDAVERYYTDASPCVMLRQVAAYGRRIDGLVVADGGSRFAVEAKSSRADYRTETSGKRLASERLAHLCWYAAEPGVIPVESLPEGWGLLHVTLTDVVVARPPAGRAPEHLGLIEVRDLAWRLAAAERAACEPGSMSALRLNNERLSERLSYALDARDRERARADDAAAQVLAALGDQVCADCHEPVVYSRTRAWSHVRRSAEADCAPSRAEAHRQAREAATGATYVRGETPPVMPAALVDRRPVPR